MYNNGLIKLVCRDKDLDQTPEFWMSETFEHRSKGVLDHIESKTGFPPSKNMRPFHEIEFCINNTITLSDIIDLGIQLKQQYSIECFQCSINRESNTAHMLFDRYDKEHNSIVYIVRNRSQIKAMSVMIYRTLNLPRPKDSEMFLRFFLMSEYTNNPNVFNDIHKLIKRANLNKHAYNVLSDVLAYIQLKCKGLTK